MLWLWQEEPMFVLLDKFLRKQNVDSPAAVKGFYLVNFVILHLIDFYLVALPTLHSLGKHTPVIINYLIYANKIIDMVVKLVAVLVI